MFKPGIEVFFDQLSTQKFRVAAVTNFTGRNRQGRHLVNLIAAHPSLQLVRIFTPEHGFTSDAPDGEHVADSHHAELEVPVVSLYGDLKKPNPEMLTDLDLLIYDIQDVGVRFYTYISTLRNIMEAAGESKKPLWILDRPDILGGIEVEGPMLAPEFTSFVGHLPIPVRYGMTPGELAQWWNETASLNVDLKIWKCHEYVCSNSSPVPDFPWFKPSPGMPDTATAQFYPGTCLFEGTQLSEGRGTDAPFRTLGAPWVDARTWAEELRQHLPEEIEISTCTFVPTFSKFANETCHGIKLATKLPIVKNAFLTGIAAIYSFIKTHPGKIEFSGRPNLKYPFIDYLAGTDGIRKGLVNLDKPELIVRKNRDGVDDFNNSRQNFLLYPRD